MKNRADGKRLPPPERPPVKDDRFENPRPPQPRQPKPMPPLANFLILSVLIVGFDTGLRSGLRWIESENEKVRLEKENVANQLALLRNLVSPHFLFNSLTALKELISQDTVNAQHYINHLSQVLRYTLKSNQSQTRTLKEEIEVADSYIFLLKVRFGNNLLIDKQIDEKYNNHRLPPLAVQTLLENAIKHNEISRRHPLAITIETKRDGTLRVNNMIQERNSPDYSSGIGLSDLAKQYMFLSGKEILISRKNNEFMVEIPLLIPLNNESNNC